VREGDHLLGEQQRERDPQGGRESDPLTRRAAVGKGFTVREGEERDPRGSPKAQEVTLGRRRWT
jgi:hypothetical protein